MDDDALVRKARQNLRTDQLFGLDAVPRGRRRSTSAADASGSLSPPPADSDKATALAHLDLEHRAACPLCVDKVRSGQCANFVFGEGDPDAALMFIGEGPGVEEDRLGRPFVGRAGQLLDKQIAAMGLRREQVYIANIVKSRPPGNRIPTPEESDLCSPYLRRQIEIVRPTVIVALGATAAKYLLDEPRLAITRQRGTWREYDGIALMPTFHPAYLLRQYTPDNRAKVWSDLQKVMEKIGLKP